MIRRTKLFWSDDKILLGIYHQSQIHLCILSVVSLEEIIFISSLGGHDRIEIYERFNHCTMHYLLLMAFRLIEVVDGYNLSKSLINIILGGVD